MHAQSEAWTPSSWRHRPIEQQPAYADLDAVARVADELRERPPLVAVHEIDRLKARLAGAQQGRAFVLQGGNCAERFSDCRRDTIGRQLDLLNRMSALLMDGLGQPVISIGRIAGQFAKPRSKPTEVVSGVVLPTWRGDSVHAEAADVEARAPDPQRMMTAYHHSAATMNFIRGNASRSSEVFVSHEGLLLAYEEAFTAAPDEGLRHYNLATHFLWIGERTRHIDGAHVEYFRGIANPIGVKVGPALEAGELAALVERLNPNNEPGRLTLITRYGAARIAEVLPAHLEAVRRTGIDVLWSSDPMHGNGITAPSGKKTRRFETIISELAQAHRIHRASKSRLGGVHLEMTGEHVTECLGGAQSIQEEDLELNYATACDPRLNHSQSLEMACVLRALFEAEVEAPDQREAA